MEGFLKGSIHYIGFSFPDIEDKFEKSVIMVFMIYRNNNEMDIFCIKKLEFFHKSELIEDYIKEIKSYLNPILVEFNIDIVLDLNFKTK